MTERERDRRVRREASGLEWAGLTQDQRHAGEQVLELLAELAAPNAHGERRNQVILIDGPRGTGKTTVLASILRLFRGDLEAKLRRGLATVGGRRPPDDKAGIASGGSTPVWRCPDDVALIPLDPLDLHPLGEETDLTIALAGRIKAWIEEPPGEGSPCRGDRSFTDSWNRLVEAIATAGVGSRERLARVGPDQLSVELRQGVFELQPKFTAFVDRALAQVANRLADDRVLFVLPIDDADLVPRRTTEVMQLLRAFHHPSVAFLLTGDSSLFVRALRASILEQLWGHLRALPSEREQRDAVDPADYASELARDLYDRVVPWPHRCRVRKYDPPHPLDEDSGPLPDQPEARGWWRANLARLPVQRERAGRSGVGTANRTIASMFSSTPPAVTEHERSLGDESSTPFIAALQSVAATPEHRYGRALPVRARALIDLRLVLAGLLSRSEAKSGDPTAPSWRFLHHLWNVAVGRSDLPVEQEIGLRHIVSLDERTSRSGEEIALRIESSRDGRRIGLEAVTEHLFRASLGATVSFRSVVRFDARLSQAAGGHAPTLPRAVGDCLALILDCEDEDRRSTTIGPLPLPSPESGALVIVEAAATGVQLPWPTPRMTPLQIDRTSKLLKVLLYDSFEGREDTQVEGAIGLIPGASPRSPETLFGAWIEVTTQVLIHPHELSVGRLLAAIPTSAADGGLGPELRATILREHMSRVASRLRDIRGDRAVDARSWFAALAVFASPRFGLGPAMANAVVSEVMAAFRVAPDRPTDWEATLPLDAALSWCDRVVPTHTALRQEIEEAIRTRVAPSKKDLVVDKFAFFSVPTWWTTGHFTRESPARIDGYLRNIESRRTAIDELNSAFWFDRPVPDSRESVVAQLRAQLDRGVRVPRIERALLRAVPHPSAIAATVVVDYEPSVPDLPDDDRLARLVLFDLEMDDAVGLSDEMGADFPIRPESELAWPMPPIRGGYDLERFAQVWNSSVTLGAWPSAGGPSWQLLPGANRFNTADLLFARYVSIWHMVCFRLPVPTEATAALRDLLARRQNEDAYSDRGSRRWLAYRQFREELGAMRDQRFGLSPETGRHIKNVWEAVAKTSDVSFESVLDRVVERQKANAVAEALEKLP